FSSDTGSPEVNVGSIRLVEDTTSREANNRQAGELRVSEVLQLLQELPLGRLAVHDLRLPYWQDRIDIEVDSNADALLARISSGEVVMRSRLSLGDSTAAAQLQASIDSGNSTALTLQLRLTPTGDAYQLSGEGQVNT